MTKSLFPSHDVSRRQFASNLAKSLLGVSLLPVANELLAAESAQGGKAKSVIFLFMNGAMSQLDTFDPKPDSDVQGETGIAKTKNSAIILSEHFPKLANRIDKAAIVRSLGAETGAHQPGRYLMRTAYKEIASTRHPGMGAWTQKFLGKANPELPANVVIGNATQHPGSGFLPAQFSPVPIGDPSEGLQNVQPPKYLRDNQFEHRMSLANQFDSAFQKRYRHREVDAYTQLYGEAIKLLKSKDLKAFDLNEEPAKLRESYGDHKLGQGCLLARRLVQSGVRFVEVIHGNWDHHRDLFSEIPETAGQLDQALGALLADLESQGLLEQTLVVVGTEFGRKPQINVNSGRDHHPGVFSGLLAGGGIRGGEVHGASDENAFAVEEDPVTVQDFNATIAYALGLPMDQEVISPAGRPFKVGADGIPLKHLFS